MRTVFALRWWMVATALLLPALGCAQASASPSDELANRASRSDVLVTINEVPIGKADVAFRLKNESHDTPKSGDAVDKNKAVLEGLIRQEAAAQKAIELGLDKDPKYQESLRQIEVQMNAFRRKELSLLYYRHEVEKKSDVTDAEAQKYYDENSARIRTEVRVSQILLRSEAAIEKARDHLAAGASFDEVAAPYFPKGAGGGREPWDLGYLSWHQVPQAWRNVVYDLPVGANSEIIRGANERFWIVRVVDRRENAGFQFDAVKEAIKNDLKSGKMEQTREQVDHALMEKVRVVYSPPVAADSED
jgi:parvulin-like peptidyl-prolyl isomerase